MRHTLHLMTLLYFLRCLAQPSSEINGEVQELGVEPPSDILAPMHRTLHADADDDSNGQIL